MNIWLVMILSGLATFGIRYSFIYLFGKFEVPAKVQQALRFVPPAVLTAIVFPEVLIRSEQLALTFSNERLLASILAALVAWFTKNILLTLLAGMSALLILQYLV